MSHVRRQIREAVATAVTGLSTTSTRVFQSRVYPLRDADLPCLLVSTESEEIEPATIGSIVQRAMEIHVKAVAKANVNLDDTLDQIALEVETAMAGAIPLAHLSKIDVDMDDALEKPTGVLTLTYRITVFTAAGNPGTLI